MTIDEHMGGKDDLESKRDFSVRENRVYVVSAYHADNEGNLIPELPDLGPCHHWDQRPCKLGIDHYRDRKSGPGFPISVIRCRTHQKGFTIYPPGFVPYARQPLTPVAPDGHLTTATSGAPLFTGTYFDAALDAAAGRFWPRESTSDSLSARYGTQKRHLSRALLLLGIQPGLHARLREEAAQILAVPGQLLHDSAALIQAHPNYHNQGKAICHVLDVLKPSASLFERLADAGAGVCLWPALQLWDPRQKILRLSPFRPIRTRASPR
jgi:hypothetical protein